MTVHLLYLYRQEGLNGAELRYSLRSIEKHLHMGDIEVTIVGDKPEWLVNANHVPAENIHPTKPACMAYKTWLGCKELEGVTDPVVYMEDDSLLMDHQTSIAPVYWGDLKKHIDRIERAHYVGFWMSDAMKASLRFLGDHPNPQSWELHRPTPIDPTTAIPVIEPLAKKGFPALCRSVWGTLTLEGWMGEDSRFIGTTASSKRFMPWVSLDECVPQTIKRTFPEPSRWERT